MVNILHWTEGQGTGHIKRINALLRCTDSKYENKDILQGEEKVNYWVKAEDPKFHYLLPDNATQWDGHYPNHFDLVVLDLEDELDDHSILQRAKSWLQLCRVGSPLNLPSDIESSLVQVSFENCSINQMRNMPYFGCLLDASSEEVLSRSEGRYQLSLKLGTQIKGSLALTHANSANSHAALVFLQRAIESLVDKHDMVIAATGHNGVIERLREKYRNANVQVCNLSPVYTFYQAFDELVAPMGYNTYHEVNLFYQGKVTFVPMYPPDQALRFQEMPAVDKIGNQDIFHFITKVAKAKDLHLR